MSSPLTQNPWTARWLNRTMFFVAWAAIVLAIAHPPHGLGVPICLTQAATGIPCPGCGLTRSLSCAVRGMLRESWSYNPFGLVMLPIFASIVLMSVLPGWARARTVRAMDSHPQVVRWAYLTLTGAFVAFGIGRASLHLMHSHPTSHTVAPADPPTTESAGSVNAPASP